MFVVVVVGLGKIVVLVIRIIEKLINELVNLNVDELLIVIFINVFVVEMKFRIGKGLEEVLV